METRKSEIRGYTSDTKRMLNMYVASSVKRHWTEDFVNDDNGEITTIDRYETICPEGEMIDKTTLQRIEFFMQSGEIKEVEITNQKREGFELRRNYMYLYIATVKIGEKNSKYLLYAQSIDNVIEIVRDFLELKVKGGFRIVNVKEFDSYIVLTDELGKKINKDIAFLQGDLSLEGYAQQTDDDDAGDKPRYYQLDLNASWKDGMTGEYFIVESKTVERSLLIIGHYLKSKEVERKEREERDGHDYEMRDYTLEIIKAVPFTVNQFIPEEFSQAYVCDQQ